MEPPAQQIARRPHRRRIDIRLGQHSPSQQDRNLVGVELIVLRFAAVNRLHRERVAQHEGDALGCAPIGEPVPREHALGRHDQIVPVRCDDLEKRLRRRFHVAVHQHLATGVENTDVHGLHVEIDSAIVTVLTVVESHRSSSCAVAHLPCASLLIISRSRGRPE